MHRCANEKNFNVIGQGPNSVIRPCCKSDLPYREWGKLKKIFLKLEK